MIKYFITGCLFLVGICADKYCSDVFRCPKVQMNNEELIQPGNNGIDIVREDYIDVYCRFAPELIDCFKQYEDVCTSEGRKNEFQMIRNTYKPICQDYKTEISSWITPCVNNPLYQHELSDCFHEAVEFNNGPNSTPENCWIDMWASCSIEVLKKCSPANAHVIFSVVKAAKPEICLLKE